MTEALIVAALAASLFVRAAILHVSATAAVDHYYWLLAARAYRTAPGLPARIVGKYLLEDERQAYPPFFGWFLSRMPEAVLTSLSARWYSQAVDAVLMALAVSYAWTAGWPFSSMAVIVAIVGMAPILAAYNTQLTSRAFGNLFLMIAVLAALGGLKTTLADLPAILAFAAAALAVAAVVLTHKMSTQLLVFCWPLWLVVEQDWQLIVVPFAGVAIAALVTGSSFAKLQWHAHWDIVTFWHKHHCRLGAHAFNDSPVYQNDRRGATLFHKPGMRGAVSHFARAFSYNPFAWLAPILLIWASTPPQWIVVWTLGPLAFALLTLYVPQLRCLGGGHLYVFNSVAPSALWWAFAVLQGDPRTLLLFAGALVAAIAALYAAYQTRRGAASVRDSQYRAALEHLAVLKPGRLAIFPVNAAEEAAFRTPHAVLWGGHSLGFTRLEPVYPVLQKPIGDVLRAYRCNYFMFDTRYWPEGAAVIARELSNPDVMNFGSWCVVHVPREVGGDEKFLQCAASLA